MMQKALGAVLILLCGALIGMRMADGLKRRCTVLQAFLDALRRMQAEITLRLTPIPDLLYQMAEDAPEPLRPLFAAAWERYKLERRPLAQTWAAALEDAQLPLSPEAAEILRSLGQALGAYEAQEQARMLSYSAQRLQQCLEQAQAESATRGRLWRRLCPAMAAVVAILLL